MTVTQSAVNDIDSQTIRHVLGHFASGVVIVTAQTADGPVGVTCQSFTSLSLDPPLVLFCPSKASWGWAQIRQAGNFCVNILDQSQESLGLKFSRRSHDKFSGVPYRESQTGAPVLEGTSGWIDCQLHAVHNGGDHDIAIGRVVDLGVEKESAPLVFYRGQFGRFSC